MGSKQNPQPSTPNHLPTTNRVVLGSNPSEPIVELQSNPLTVNHEKVHEKGSDNNYENTDDIISTEILTSLPKHRLEGLILALRKELRRRYIRKKPSKYGNLNKGFTDEELGKFLSCCLNLKAKLAFRLMANLGLRIGEVARIRIYDIDLNNRRFQLISEKTRKADSLYLHDEVLEILKLWMDTNYEEIVAHDGYILYSEVKCNKMKHVSSHWLRNAFRQAAILSGLNETYGHSDEMFDRAERRLHRLTTHSLRHYFITKVYKTLKDPIIAQKLARHSDIKSTQVYIHTAQNDLDGSLSRVFEKNLLDKQKEQEDLKKLVQMWGLLR